MNKQKVHILLELGIIILAILSIFVSFWLIPVAIIVLGVFSLSFLILEEDTSKADIHVPPEEENLELEEAPVHTDIDLSNHIDEKEFAKEMFLLYRDIQTDFMNFDYENLRSELGVELYEQFSKQLQHLETTNRQSVRTNIDLNKIQITSYESGKDKDIAIISLSVLEDKYMKKKEEPFRLTSNKVRYESCYTLTFIKHHRKKIFRKCTYCSQKLQGNPAICPYCGHLLLESTSKWILKDLKLVCSYSYSETKKENLR